MKQKFLESCGFFGITTLLPVLITWGIMARFESTIPSGSEEIDAPLLMLVIFPIIVGILLIVGMSLLRHLPTLKTRKQAVVVPLIFVYVTYEFVYFYQHLLPWVAYAALWVAVTVLVPGALVSLTGDVPKRRLIFQIMASLVIGTGLFMAGQALRNN